jgi:PHS family inorganic phosphate transporter-like MFS transporter
MTEFLEYFSEWRHLKILIGTAGCWFLLDIAYARLSIHRLLSCADAFPCSFYGINLNQNVVLQQIGFDGKSGTPWESLFKLSVGNIIITALGFVPGAFYFFYKFVSWAVC